MPSPTDRPWLRRDTIYAPTPSGVQVTNASSGFELGGADVYRLFRAVHPLLDGSRSVAELIDALGTSRWSKIRTLLDPLSEHGFLRWIPEADVACVDAEIRAEFVDQISFLAQYTDQPHAAFARFRRSRVHVIGSGPFAATVRDNLIANGLQTVLEVEPSSLQPETGEHVVTAPTAEGLRWLSARRWGPGQGAVLPVLPDADTLWCLPHSWHASPTGPTWMDGVCALVEGGRLGDLEQHWQRAATGVVRLTPYTAAEAVQRMLGVLVAYELFKGLSGALPAETANGAIAFDARTGQATAHPVHPHAWRHAATAHGTPAESSVAGSTPGHSEAEDYPRWERLVGAPTLPVVEFADEDLLQLPLKLGAARRPDGSVHVAASLWTTADARIEAVAAIYRDRVASFEVHSTTIDLEGPDGRSTVPTGSVLTLSTQNAHGRFPPTSSGIGVGMDPTRARARAREQAVLDHLVPLAAADGLAVPVTWSDDSPEAEFLRGLSAAGPDIRLVELGSVHGVHAIAAVEGDGDDARWHAAAAAGVETAISESLVGLHGARQAALDPGGVTPAMRRWPQVDPAQFSRPAASGHRAECWIGTADIGSPELESLGLSAAAARVLPSGSG